MPWPFPLLASDAGRRALLILAALLAVLGGLWWLRRDAADDARAQDRAQAAQEQESINAQGNAAARDAERVGAGRLLESGRF